MSSLIPMQLDPLVLAESFVAQATPAHARAMENTAALGSRIVELSAARRDADAALEAKRRSSAAALRDVKLVAARMVQERESTILSLKRQLTEVSRVLADDSVGPPSAQNNGV